MVAPVNRLPPWSGAPCWRCIGGPLHGLIAFNTGEQFVYEDGNKLHVYSVGHDGTEQVFRFENTVTIPRSESPETD